MSLWAVCCSVSIVESRKEKSRDAARHRRGQENNEFNELSKLLPLSPDITSQYHPLQYHLHNDLRYDLHYDLHNDLQSKVGIGHHQPAGQGECYKTDNRISQTDDVIASWSRQLVLHDFRIAAL